MELPRKWLNKDELPGSLALQCVLSAPELVCLSLPEGRCSWLPLLLSFTEGWGGLAGPPALGVSRLRDGTS